MNCNAFVWSCAQRLDFRVTLNLSNPPYWNGDIIFSNDYLYRSKRERLCGSNLIGPKFTGTCWQRWNVFFQLGSTGYLGSVLDATGIGVPQEDVNNWGWPNVGYFRPWDNQDPFYARALTMFDAKPEDQKTFILTLPYREGNSTYYITTTFAIAQDQEEAPVFYANYPIEPIGTAKLTLKRK